MQKQNYIFLDVDGVLNDSQTQETAPSEYKGVENKYIAILKKIVDMLNAKIILVSDWKEDWTNNYEDCAEDMKYLIDKLDNYDLEITDITIDHKGTYYRGQGIKDWLENHPEADRYIILDDNGYDYYMHEDIRKNAITTINGLEEVEPYTPESTNVEDVVEFINNI